jgi:hypothetical protein
MDSFDKVLGTPTDALVGSYRLPAYAAYAAYAVDITKVHSFTGAQSSFSQIPRLCLRQS